MTRLYGVIGDPIGHSLSPVIHSGWLDDFGIEARYEALHVPAGDFDKALKSFKSRGYSGLNVTLPHKGSALACASSVSDSARAIGAANTLSHMEGGTWRADNTDAPGFLEALGPVDRETDHVLILGAGGSARAIAYALSDHGVSFTVLNRTVERAKALAEAFCDNTSVYGSIESLADHIDNATIVINTTSLGYDGEIFQLPAGNDRLFFDISYGEIAAPQLDHAADQGWRTRDGLTMLVAQAAISFEIWFDVRPNFDLALKRCQSALEASP